jgi:hypothetical protein
MAAANENNVRFNLDDADNVEDNVRHNDGLQDGGNGQQQMPQFAIPEGVDQATANLLTMQKDDDAEHDGSDGTQLPSKSVPTGETT